MPDAEGDLSETVSLAEDLHNYVALAVDADAEAAVRVDQGSGALEFRPDFNGQRADVGPRIIGASWNGDLTLRRRKMEADLASRQRRDRGRNAVAMPGRSIGSDSAPAIILVTDKPPH